MSSILDRFAQTDREIRKLKFQLRIVTILCIGSVGGFLYTLGLQSKSHSRSARSEKGIINTTEIRAKKFIVLDNAGRARGQLSALKGSTVLFFFKDGVIASKYGINSRGRPFMSLYDQTRDSRFSLGLDKKDNFLMTFNDRKGTPRLQIKQPRAGGPKMDVFNAKRKRIKVLVK